MRSLFVTKLYEAEIDDGTLLGELAHSIRTLAEDDQAGRTLVEASITTRLHELRLAQRPAEARSGLRRAGQAADAACRKLCRGMRLRTARKPRLDSLWVNLLRGGGQHSGHIHPHSIMSGTLLCRSAARARARSASRTRACR